MCQKVTGRCQQVSERCHRCQEGVIGVRKVSNVTGMCKQLSRICQQVTGRCQQV